MGKIPLFVAVYRSAVKPSQWVCRIETRPLGVFYFIDFRSLTKREAVTLATRELRRARKQIGPYRTRTVWQ